MSLRIFKGTFSRLIILAVLTAAASLSELAQSEKTVEPDRDVYYRRIADANASIKKNPSDSKAYYNRGSLYVGNKEYESAMADYNQAINLDPKFYEAYSGRGYIYLQYKLYAEAIKEFNRAKELNPADSYAADNLAYIGQQIKRSDLSLEEYNNLIKAEPTNPQYYYYRSRLYLKAKNYFQAIEDASKAIEFNSEYKEAYITRAIGYCEIGKWKESTADIAKHEQLIGKSLKQNCFIELSKNLKYCLGSDDDCRIAVYTAGIDNPGLIRFSPGLGDFYAGRGLIYFESGKYDLAHSDFEDADKYFYTIKDDRIALYLGNILFDKGKYNEALTKFNEVLKVKPESAEASLRVGEIYVIKREYEKALEYFDRALFLNPRLAKAYFGRGVVYYENGRNYGEFENNQTKAAEFYKKAVKDFENVIEINLLEAPPEVYIKRAKAYEKLGEQAKADLDRAKYLELTEKP